MKRFAFLGGVALVASTLMAADSKDDVTSAAKKLSDASSYSWKATTENAGGGGGGGGGRFRMGPTEGKAEKGGFTHVTMTFGDNPVEVVVKGDKGAIKTPDGWKSLDEATQDDGGGQPNPGRFMAMRFRNYKTPAMQIAEVASKIKDLKKSDDAYSGDLSEESVKELLTFGPRAGGGNGPDISNAKGTAKFWVKDGAISKYQVHVQGTVSFNGNDREVDRTTTVEIKDVGSTKVDVPEEARKKIAS
jgi:hypothetical protein